MSDEFTGCGECGDARIVLEVLNKGERGWTMRCGNGHVYAPIPGQFFEIDLNPPFEGQTVEQVTTSTTTYVEPDYIRYDQPEVIVSYDPGYGYY